MKKKIMMTLMALSLSCAAVGIGTEEVKAAETGLKQVNGEWCYVTNGKVDGTKSGFVEYEGGLFFVSYGKLVSEANGLMQDPINVSDWYYLAGGQAQTQYTGLAEYDGEWFYVEQGKLDTTMNAFVEYDSGLFFVGAGRIMDEVNGLAQDPQGENWYYLANGQVQTEYTGLAEYDGEWFYIESGVFMNTYEGTVNYNGGQFYVKNGQVIDGTEKKEEIFGFTIEKGMQKIQRLYDAHTVLLSQNKQLENDTQRCVESLDFSNFDNSNAITADGSKLDHGFVIDSMLIDYYNHYVNENGEYYDFKEWLSTQESTDSILSKYFSSREETVNTKDILLFEAIGLIAYMKSCDSVNPVEMIETTEYTVSDRQSAYVITLACNGENELYAVYDADGNLLNIWPIADDWDKYISSFPELT